MQGQTPQETAGGTEASSALGEQAIRAYERDLPKLLQERPGQWVAYHGDQLIGFARTPPELWQEIGRRGFRGRDCIVLPIEEDSPPEVFDSPYPFD
jgi:hypothetical protein